MKVKEKIRLLSDLPENERTRCNICSKLFKELAHPDPFEIPEAKRIDKECEAVAYRYGLDGKGEHTLEEISAYFGVSKEYARQMILKAVRIFRELLISPRSTRYYDLDEYFTEHVSFADIDCGTKHAYVFESALNELRENGEEPLSPGMVTFMMDVYNYEELTYDNVKFFVNRSSCEPSVARKMPKVILKLLREAELPLSEFELIVGVKAQIGNKKIANDAICEIASVLPFVLKKGFSDATYELQFTSLGNVIDKAYRVLREQNRPLHYSEILSHIKEKDPSESSTAASLRSRLAMDKRFKAIGKSGEWALADAKIETRSIRELIDDVFQVQKKPLTFKELLAQIKTLRPSITENTLYAIINVNKINYIKLVGGRFAPAGWKNSYEHEISSYTKLVIDNSEFDTFIIDLFRKRDLKRIQSSDLARLLEMELSIALSTAEKRISNSLILKKEKDGQNAFFVLRENYKEILEMAGNKVLKSDKIIAISKQLINKAPDGRAKLADIVKYLLKNENIPKASTYKAISLSMDLMKVVIDDETYVQKVNAEPGTNNGVTEILKLISQKESDTLEFKSSMRYSYKELPPGVPKDKNMTRVLEFTIAKEIAAFLNTSGGTLLIGVEDDGKIIGLQKDYSTLSMRQDSDGFLQAFVNVINNLLGPEYHGFIKAHIISVEDKQVGRVVVTTGESPTFIKNPEKNNDEEFYIRTSATCAQLKGKAMLNYIKDHWKD